MGAVTNAIETIYTINFIYIRVLRTISFKLITKPKGNNHGQSKRR
jgi:hypothetical protein